MAYAPGCSTPEECLDHLGLKLESLVGISLRGFSLAQLQVHEGSVAVCCCHGPILIYCLCVQLQRLQQVLLLQDCMVHMLQALGGQGSTASHCAVTGNVWCL